MITPIYCCSPKSDALIKLHSSGHIGCWSCKLMVIKSPFSDGVWHDHFFTRSYCKMIDHVKQHQEAGHKVPNSVISILLRQQRENGDEVPIIELDNEAYSKYRQGKM